MIIKCPQCSTGYSIPENMIGDKPRKMRCSRCKNVFTIIRRKEAAPTGYEEFTGSQQLPDEFAFLRESPAVLAAPPQPSRPESQPAQPEPQPSRPEPQTAQPEPQPSAPDGPPIGQDTIPIEPELVTPAAVSRPTPPPRQSATSPVADIYGGSASAWEMEAPLELSGYALLDESGSAGGQFVGKLMTIIIVLIVIFFVFVAFRNGWSISVPKLGEQIAFAFSGAEFEEPPDEVKDLEATIAQSRIVIARDKTTYLVVFGEVLSNSPISKANVILRGRLLDSAGDIRGEVRAPCGKVSEDSVIEGLEKGSAQGLYRQRGELYNCQLSGHGSTVFQLIFEDVPADYDSSFNVEVRPVAATLPQ